MEDEIIEFLAHEVVYKNFLDYKTKTYLSQLGILPHELFSDPVTGLQMMGFSPINQNFLKYPVLAFRGTTLDLNEVDEFSALTDIYADLEDEISSNQFDNNVKNIIRTLEILKGLNNQKVVVAGHSLGGALAQNILTLNYPLLKKNIERIVTFQSPGINYNRIEKILKNIKDPKRQIKSFHYRMKSGFVDNSGEVFSPGIIIEYNFNDMPKKFFDSIGQDFPYKGMDINTLKGIKAHTFFPLKISNSIIRKEKKIQNYINKFEVGNNNLRPIELLRKTPKLFENIYTAFNIVKDNLKVDKDKEGKKEYSIKNFEIVIQAILKIYEIRDSVKKRIDQMNRIGFKEYIDFKLIKNVERVILIELVLFDFTVVKIIEHFVGKSLGELARFSIDNSASTKRIVKSIIWSANLSDFKELSVMLNTYQNNCIWIKSLFKERNLEFQSNILDIEYH